ncbi:hypothetical protein AX15_003525 [Amanita polypyramis BW_CC]|nr:hypothetical protein AX15_003525 [Amanita polypyramis BW_CC]
MAVPSREYSLLLSHLHSDKSSAPLAAIQNALSHHLVHLHPLPTSLAATAVSAPLYLSQPLTHEKLQSLATAFRHAVHFKLQALEKSAETRSTLASLFARDHQGATAQWTIHTVRGLQGGQPVMRLTCLSGLLLGIEDIQKTKHEQGRIFDAGQGRDMVENELIISVAEIVDSYAVEPRSDWEKEFKPALVDSEMLSLSLILASQCLSLVSRTKLKALPLSVLNRMLVSAITEAFHAGTFLSSLSTPSTSATRGSLRIPDSYGLHLKTLMSSPAYSSLALLSKLTALTLELSLDTRSQRIQQAMETSVRTLSAFEQMARVIEANWNSGPLLGRKDGDIESTSRSATKDLWSILKTFLFSTVMIAQALLNTVIYAPPHLFAPSIRPQDLSIQVLNTLYHLSFVVSEFGGIAPDSGSFSELKRTTYLALDILTQEPKKAEAFVRQISLQLGVAGNGQRCATNMPHEVQQSKKAFTLVCLEQLVPVLSIDCIRSWVWEMCYPQLSDTSHRELYESAHSVILAILASHAPFENGPETNQLSKVKGPPEARSSDNFVTRIIPFYAQCLVENSGEGKLGTAQLQLAYSALVRSAGASSAHVDDTFNPIALAWYCVETLLEAIQDLSKPDLSKVEDKGEEKERQTAQDAPAYLESHLHRLHLTLVATVPSLPPPLLLPVLDKIRDTILEGAYPQHHPHPIARTDEAEDTRSSSGVAGEGKAELVNALFKEIFERVGDGEKETVMRWWYDNLGRLEVAVQGEQAESSDCGQDDESLSQEASS